MLPDSSEPDSSPPRPDAAAGSTGDRAGELVLLKNGQRFVFRCAPGQETQLLDRVSQLVRDPRSGLSWFDAAVLSHQVGLELGQRLKQQMRTMGARAAGSGRA